MGCVAVLPHREACAQRAQTPLRSDHFKRPRLQRRVGCGGDRNSPCTQHHRAQAMIKLDVHGTGRVEQDAAAIGQCDFAALAGGGVVVCRPLSPSLAKSSSSKVTKRSSDDDSRSVNMPKHGVLHLCSRCHIAGLNGYETRRYRRLCPLDYSLRTKGLQGTPTFLGRWGQGSVRQRSSLDFPQEIPR